MKVAAPWIESAERVSARAAVLGWAPGTGGNFSVDLGGPLEPRGIPDLLELGAAVPRLAGRTFLVSRSDARFRELDGQSDVGFVRPLSQGDRAEVWFPGEGVPTFEVDTHLAIHAALRAMGAKARAVLHVHPPRVVALTHVQDHQNGHPIEEALLGAHPEVAYQLRGGIGYVPYTRSGATTLARLSAELVVRGVSAVIWGLHGCFAMAEDLPRCLDIVELIESAARIRLAALSTARPIQGLRPEQIADLQRLRAEQPSMWQEGREM